MCVCKYSVCIYMYIRTTMSAVCRGGVPLYIVYTYAHAKAVTCRSGIERKKKKNGKERRRKKKKRLDPYRYAYTVRTHIIPSHGRTHAHTYTPRAPRVISLKITLFLFFPLSFRVRLYYTVYTRVFFSFFLSLSPTSLLSFNIRLPDCKIH